MFNFIKEKNRELYKTTIGLLIITIVISLFVAFRVVARGRLGYTFLIWNIFLAWIPFYLSILLTQKEYKSMTLKFLTAFFWIMFYPNAPYIITDFIHLSPYDFYGKGSMFFNNKLSMWYDFFLITVFVIVGLVLSYKSLKLVYIYCKRKYNKLKAWIVVVTVCFLSGYAIYLGRFIRVNSWEVVTNPIGLIYTLLENLNKNCLILSVLFGIMLLIIYLTFDFIENSKEQG
jgi:uncharacterized membrane protein